MSTTTPKPTYMIVNGKLIPYADGTLHLMSPAARYGLNVFEGMRAYWNDETEQLYVFRLAEHLERLRQSMKMLRFEPDFGIDDVFEKTLELLRENRVKEMCHIRANAYLGGEGEHHVPGPVSYFVASKVRPRSPKTATGIRCRVSTWTRMADNAMPPRIKCGANYVNARLARYEAFQDGYDDALMLNGAGRVAEGPGACVFMMRAGRLVTPSVTEGILESITRSTLIELARDQGITVEERPLDRTELYACDELFIAGSAAEVLPVIEVDGIAVGEGQIGDTTSSLQDAYFATVTGSANTNKSWLTPVYPATATN